MGGIEPPIQPFRLHRYERCIKELRKVCLTCRFVFLLLNARRCALFKSLTFITEPFSMFVFPSSRTISCRTFTFPIVGSVLSTFNVLPFFLYSVTSYSVVELCFIYICVTFIVLLRRQHIISTQFSNVSH